MRILWICPFVPYPPSFGGGIRIYQLIRSLAERHAIDVVCLGDERSPRPAPLLEVVDALHVFKADRPRRRAQLRALWTGRSAMELAYRSKALDAWVAEHGRGYDVVVCEMTQMAWTPIPEGPLTVLNLHNLEGELLGRTAESDAKPWRRVYRKWDAARLSRAERAVLERFDRIACCSRRELETLSEWGYGGRARVVPNGVDTAFFDASPEPESSVDIGFIGTAHYYPNEQGVLWFHEQVWPRLIERHPYLRFACVGGHPRAALQAIDRPEFRIVGRVDDIRPHFKACRLLVVPLLSGSGTRLKILEGAAAGVPMVSTSLGCEGLSYRHEVHGLVADSPTDFAEACLSLLHDRARAQGMATRARHWAEREYEWSSIGTLFEEWVQQGIDAAFQQEC